MTDEREPGRGCACEGGTLTRFLQPLILSFLTEKPCHGYDLLSRIADTSIWGEMPPDHSGVYRALRDMEKRGLLTSEIVHPEGVSLGRRVYALTVQGQLCRHRWLETLVTYQENLREVIALLEKADTTSSP